MAKISVSEFKRGRKCIFCNARSLYRLRDGRVKCKKCGQKYSLCMLKKDLDVLYHFYLEISARKAAKALGLSYNAVRRRYMEFRDIIAEHLEKEFEQLSGELELDESYFGGKRKGKRGRGALNKALVFGILERNGKVFTRVVPNASAETLLSEIEQKTQKGSVFYTDCFKSYASLKCFGAHKKINHEKCFGRGRNHINGLEGYWSFAKERFHKYHGISKKNYTLYLKEMEFRYNYRNEDYLSRMIQIVFGSKIGPKMN